MKDNNDKIKNLDILLKDKVLRSSKEFMERVKPSNTDMNIAKVKFRRQPLPF